MGDQKQRIMKQTIAFVIFIAALTVFLLILSAKFERMQQAAYTGDYQTIQEETKTLKKFGEQTMDNGLRTFLTAGIIVIIVGIIAYEVQNNKKRGYRKSLAIAAEEHHLAYHQENAFAYPVATGSDNEGLIMIEIEKNDDGKDCTTITLGMHEFQEAIIINKTGNQEIHGSKQTINRIQATTKQLLNDHKGKWTVKPGELLYEHVGVVASPETLSELLTTAKKLRKDLS